MEVIHKDLSLTQKEFKKQDSFSLFSYIILLDINTLGSTIFNHCNPIMEEVGLLILQKLLHSSYGLISFSEIATMKVGFEFKK